MKLSEQLLARILKDPKILFETGEMISDVLFKDYRDKEIFKVFKGQALAGESTDVITLSNKSNHPDEVMLRAAELTSSIDYSIPLQSLLDEASVTIKQIKIDEFKDGLAKNKFNHPDDILTYASDFISGFDTSSVRVMKTMQDNVDEVLRLVEHNKNNIGLTGLDTGFYKLNNLTNGLQGGDLIVVAAETSQGKTSLALNIAHKSAEAHPVLFNSCEMMSTQITGRMLACESGIGSNHILTGQLNEEELTRLGHYSSNVAYNKMIIDDKNNNIDTIISNIRVLYHTKGIKLVVIDYLQLLHTTERGMNKEQQTAMITRRLKNLAKELSIPIILISQLRRDQINPFPRLSRLRDSGQIEEAADIVIFVYRAEYYGEHSFEDGMLAEGKAQIIIAKGRNTGTGMFYVNFDKRLTKFFDHED